MRVSLFPRAVFAAVLAWVGVLFTSTVQAAPPSFVYVSTNPDGPNAVEAYLRNRQTGQLVRIGRFPTGGLGYPFVGGFEQHAVVTNGKFLYTVNAGSDTISAFKILPNGALQLLSLAPSGGRRPVSIALGKQFLYVANQGDFPGGPPVFGSYSAFRVNHLGHPSPIPNSTVFVNAGSSPGDIVLNKSETAVIASRIPGNTIDSFKVQPNGRLSHHVTYPGGGGPFGLLTSRSGRSTVLVTLAVPELFPKENAPGLALYRIGANGFLTGLSTYTDPDKSDAGLRDPCWLASLRDDSYVWTSSFIPRSITAFNVSPKNRLTRLTAFNPMDVEPNGSVLGSTDIAISGDDRFLYQLRAFSVPDGAVPLVPRLEIFAVTRNWAINAGLAKVGSINLPADLAFAGVMGLAVTD